MMEKGAVMLKFVMVTACATFALSGCSASDEPAAVATQAEDPAPAETKAADADYVPAQQVADIPIERVEFADGENAITIADSITGYETVDYVLKLPAGVPLNVSMATQHTATYFNLIAPGEEDVAFFVGSTSGNQYEGMTELAGDYRIRVYMMRSAARREETADYRLEIIAG